MGGRGKKGPWTEANLRTKPHRSHCSILLFFTRRGEERRKKRGRFSVALGYFLRRPRQAKNRAGAKGVINATEVGGGGKREKRGEEGLQATDGITGRRRPKEPRTCAGRRCTMYWCTVTRSVRTREKKKRNRPFQARIQSLGVPFYFERQIRSPGLTLPVTCACRGKSRTPWALALAVSPIRAKGGKGDTHRACPPRGGKKEKRVSRLACTLAQALGSSLRPLFSVTGQRWGGGGGEKRKRDLSGRQAIEVSLGPANPTKRKKEKEIYKTNRADRIGANEQKKKKSFP